MTAALNLILSLHTPRKLSRNLTCRYRSREYQIQGQGHGYRLRGSTVDSFDGPISLLCQGKTLDYRVLAGQTPIDDEKSLCRTVEKARSLQRKRPKYKPAPDHPWNRWAGPFHPYPMTARLVSRPCQNANSYEGHPSFPRKPGSWRGATHPACIPLSRE